MSLLTAHRILIAAAVAFFFGFGLWEFRNYSATGDLWAFFRGVLYLMVSFGFGWYLRSLERWVK